MSDKQNKKYRRILRVRANQLFTDFMNEVNVCLEISSPASMS